MPPRPDPLTSALGRLDELEVHGGPEWKRSLARLRRDLLAARAERERDGLRAQALRRAPAVVYLLDTNGCFTFVEGGAAEAPAKLIGQSALELYGDMQTELADGSVVKASEALTRALAGETLITHSYLNGRWYDTHMAPLGPGQGVACVSHDVSERRELNEAVSATIQKEAMVSVADSVLHDLANLLMVIQARTLLLAPEVDVVEVREKILSACARSNDLCQRLLQLSRAAVEESDEPHTAVDEVLGQLSPMLQHVAGPQIELQLELGAEGASVQAPQVVIERAAFSLLSNARDAQNRPLNHVSLQTALRHDPDAPGGQGWLDLIVRDDGAGMEASVLARAREPFFTTKERRIGTGLGLSSVDSMMRRWGGLLRLHSRPGRGTTATVSLPLLPLELEAPRLAASPAASRRPRILLVEDDDELLLVLRELIETAGYDVQSAGDAELALELQGPFDALLADYSLPGLDGVELAKALRERNPKLPVILMTGYVAPQLEEVGYPLLKKPYSTGLLLDLLRSELS